MRVLFVNIIEGQAVTAVNASLNYPPESIYHPFLKKKFKSTFDNDTLTINLDVAAPADSFFMGNHNVTSGSVSFLDESLSPVGPMIDLADANDIFVEHFTQITVKRIIITIQNSNSDQVFIGGVGVGVAVTMPGMVSAGFQFEVDDATVISRSPGGQTSRNKAPSLRSRKFTFAALTQDEKNFIDPFILALGIGKPIFMHLFPDDVSADFDPAMYAEIAEPRTLTNPASGRYDLTLSLKESR